MKFKEHVDSKMRRLHGRLKEVFGRLPSAVTKLIRPSRVPRDSATAQASGMPFGERFQDVSLRF